MAERVLRVFVAVKVENGSVLEQIKRLQDELERAGLKAKMVELENMHITLQFIGEIPREKVLLIQKNLQEIKTPPFTISLEGVGAFPNPRNPRVIWIGIKKGAEELTSLAKRTAQAIMQARVKIESEDFTPHLTIARVKAPINSEVRRILDANTSTFFGEQLVSKFSLIKSTLTPKGPIYTDLAEYNLKEAENE
ncbi:MAG: RNA 2',3'-cyclic phosphodiesterase [Infirmifilum sp.]